MTTVYVIVQNPMNTYNTSNTDIKRDVLKSMNPNTSTKMRCKNMETQMLSIKKDMDHMESLLRTIRPVPKPHARIDHVAGKGLNAARSLKHIR